MIVVAACSSPRIAVPEAERLDERGRAAYQAAVAEWIADDAEGAREALAELRALEPWFVPAHVLWQDAGKLLGKHEEMAAWYASEAQRRPDDAARVLLAGRLAPRAGDGREQAYRRAAALDPASPWPSLALAFELDRRAFAAYEASIELADDGFLEDSSAQRDLAANLHAESQELSELVVARHPGLPDACAGAAEVFLTRGAALGERPTMLRALELAARAVELDPGNPSRHALLARVRRELIDDPGAEEALRRALELDPGDPDLLASLGRVLLDLGRADEARDALRRAFRRRPEDPVIAADLGVAAHRLGDLETARERLTLAAQLDPHDPRPLEALALVQLERGDGAAARKALREYLARGGADRQWAEAILAEEPAGADVPRP